MVDSLGDRLGAVLDGGECELGLESTILGLSDPGKPAVLRLGPVGVGELSEALGMPVARKAGVMEKLEQARGLAAPGTLSKHYSPNAKLCLFGHGQLPKAMNEHELEGRAYVYFKRPGQNLEGMPNCFWLSEDGGVKEAAKNLFGLLRKLDRQGFRAVDIEMAQEGGVGDAINDRLVRAAAKG